MFWGALAVSTAALLPYDAIGQTTENEAVSEEAAPSATTPASGGEPQTGGATEGDVPAVEIIQPQAEPEQPPEREQAESKPEPKRRPVSRPAPQPVVRAPEPVAYEPPAQPAFEPIEPELFFPTLITQQQPDYYGPAGGEASFERSWNGAQSPVNPLNGIAPGNLQNFSEAGSRVTRQQINEQDPFSTNDILQRVPGVNIVNDDGAARNGGIGIRGSNPRRSRKVLVMEDGQSINMSLYIDPSVHNVPPPDRIEAVEVIKGSIIYAPNNNFGAINFRNLQPFGPNEFVMSGEGGGVALEGAGSDGSAGKWHVHNRSTWGNWGTVVSYTGADVQGAWDTERLRYNDFYAALGWKDTNADFVLSGSYTRQRDNYDEANLEFEEEEDGEEEGDLAEDEELEEEEETAFQSDTVEEAFFKEVKHCKSCYNPGSRFNTYNADPFRLQGVLNYYFDEDTTSTTRVYYMHHRRDRYQNFEGADPSQAEDAFSPLFVGDEALIPEGVMIGRLRTYQHVGGEQRFELANREFVSGLNQDLQMGVRLEHHTFANRNFFGDQGEILRDGDKKGLTVFDSEHETDAVSAYLQTVIHATPAIDIVPGIRFEHFNSKVVQTASSEEEGEGEHELDECDYAGHEYFEGEECVVFALERDTKNFSFNKTYWLPGISFSWGLFGQQTAPVYDGKSLQDYETVYHTTMYGGYNRGVTIPVQREGPFPPEDELGNNFQLGLRSTGIKGVTLDMAGFFKNISNYQIKGSATTASGQNVFTSADEVQISGFEMYGRLDSRPFTGWDLNPFAEATYTYSNGEITEGILPGGESIVGNRIPFSPREVAYLTTGIESTAGWNASVSFVYRGEFYTDVENTPYGGDPSGEDGLVPSVWLLNARANYTVPQNLMPKADMVLFVSGENLTDELYITDREDGVKPGLGRSVMAGARIKW
ncbi:iron(III) dicitrate transport protein FecA [Methyloceanibacter caenitepidi]|uniref:Iron(III) dicitrate transport protein FecA n=1 Tax=Methyloceanibacter caenitepidi TaxID=1384459 RepID=A0A0A8K6P2_9HYPH|nr:iron(III) dicitrate transport protein FecA [Methyloceanibacter caenitepidi]